MSDNQNSEWEEVWDARIESLSKIFGAMDGALHSPHPFQLGGNADILRFPNHLDGTVYVTADLTGKPDEVYADYELMICVPEDSEWAASVISRLAPYTQEAYLHSGDTMDIDSAVPAGSMINALIFHTYSSFNMFGETYDVRLCLGITKDELSYKKSTDSDTLIKRLKEAGIYPMTDLSRKSILG